MCQAHPPLHTVYAAVGCGTRTAGRFGLSSCHNSPLVRHFTRVSLLCEKILGYELLYTEWIEMQARLCKNRLHGRCPTPVGEHSICSRGRMQASAPTHSA